MSETTHLGIRDYVFSLGKDDFDELCEEVENRRCAEKYGAFGYEELAARFGRRPKCPVCGSLEFTKSGFDGAGRARYACGCGARYGLLSGTVFSSAKVTPAQWGRMMSLMAYNVPLDLIAEQISVHHNTALLMRRKLFEAVAEWQGKVKLSGVVFIDEVYTFDSARPRDHFGANRRGINGDKCCVFLAIDSSLRMVLFHVGMGMPTSKRISDALLPHLRKGAVAKIVHDGLHSHSAAVAESGARDEIHKSAVKDEGSLKAMLLINSFSAWVKRFLSRFNGMDTEYLQDYLNWFVYLFRCKRQSETWPRDERVMRHLMLADCSLTRASIPAKRKASRQKIESKRRPKNG